MVAETKGCGQIWDMFGNRFADELDIERAQEEGARLTVFGVSSCFYSAD